jgi:hypothetical protein
VNYKKEQAEERTGKSAAQVVLVSRNDGIDSYWKRLGPESNCEYTHPHLSPKQKAAFAMSMDQLPSRKTKAQVEEAQIEVMDRPGPSGGQSVV